MSSRSWVALGAALLLSSAMAARAGEAPPSPAIDMRSVLLKAMAGTQTPALVAAVLRDGAIAQQAVQGVRRNDGSAPAWIDDTWLIGSDAKPMTAALVLRLVDRRLLSLETPLAELLPALAEGMQPQYRRVTLRQLLSHRSGLPDDVRDESFIAAFHADRRPMPAQRLAYIARALKDMPVATPGTTSSYSNTGFLVAAAVAERATGTPCEVLMRREVFGPLGMESVGYGTTHAGQPIGHIRGHPASQAEEGIPPMFAPAGNMHMSVGDWSRFCLDQLAGARGRGRLLAVGSYGRMQGAAGGGAGNLGWGVQDSIAGRQGPVLIHAGSDGNWYALVVLFPRTGHGALVATNAGADMGGDRAAMAALRDLLPPR